MSRKPASESVPAADLIRLATFAAIAAGLTGMVVGSLKYLAKGMVYRLTGSYGGDGAVAGLIAAVLAFLICARFAERTLESVDGNRAMARNIMLGIGAGIGVVIALVFSFAVNYFTALANP
jgi:hypothetical protein